MKNLAIVTAIFLVTIFTTLNCQTRSSRKLKYAQADIDKTEKNYKKAIDRFLTDLELFRREASVKISENEQDIKAFKVKFNASKNEVKSDCEKRINALEQKNTDLKNTLVEYNLEEKENWNDLKIEFNRELEVLGKAIKDLETDNIK